MFKMAHLICNSLFLMSVIFSPRVMATDGAGIEPPIKIAQSNTYTGHCGGEVKDSRGYLICASDNSRPVCYSDGRCNTRYDEYCAEVCKTSRCGDGWRSECHTSSPW